jgi:hypothetical protein
MMDTTGLNRLEGALRESEERFLRYFELGVIGMAITSPTKGRIESTTGSAGSRGTNAARCCA